MKVLGWIFLILIGFGIYGAMSKSGTPAANRTAQVAVTSTPAAPISTFTYAQQLHEQLPIIATFDPSKFTADVRSINMAITLMQGWAELIEQGSTTTMSADGKRDRDALFQALKAKQIVAYPKLRDAYGPAMRQVLWEADGKARTIGAGCRTIELISAAFAANRNIESTHEDMYATLRQMRFTRAQYKWLDADVEYTFYKIEPPADGEVVVWQEYGNFRTVN